MAYPVAVEDLIPHRDRMKLIDEIVEITADQAVTRTVVKDCWPLVREGGVDPLVLIEIVAQTAAVHVSGQKRGEQKGAGSGLLAGIKNADFLADRIPLGTVLTTTVAPLYSAENYTVLAGTVQGQGRTLGHVEIQVIEIGDDPDTLQEP